VFGKVGRISLGLHQAQERRRRDLAPPSVEELSSENISDLEGGGGGVGELIGTERILASVRAIQHQVGEDASTLATSFRGRGTPRRGKRGATERPTWKVGNDRKM